MNLHQLYSIQQRLAISSELTKKLRSAGEEHNRQDSSTYEIHYNGTVYNGASPSEAFLAFLTAIAVRFPLKFRTLLNVYDSETKKIVINRHDYGNTKLRLFYPEAYIDSDLSLNSGAAVYRMDYRTLQRSARRIYPLNKRRTASSHHKNKQLTHLPTICKKWPKNVRLILTLPSYRKRRTICLRVI